MGLLLMVMTIGGVFMAGVLIVFALYTGARWLRNFVIGGFVLWSIFYIALLVGVSLMSEEENLARGERKEYCGFYLDCHMHTSVTGVDRSRTIGNKTAKGEFYIVTVEVFSNAVKATLGLHSPDAYIVAADGRTFKRDLAAELELAPQPEFEKRIGPEESFRKQIVFDLPVDVASPRLDMREGRVAERLVESFLIGDEDSIFHGRSYFRLDEARRTAGITVSE